MSPAAYASSHRAFHHVERLGELAADVDVGGLGADRVRGDRAPLDQRVRRPAHDLAILERARLRLVGVAAEVVRLAVAELHERPLQARREAGAAAPAQSRLLHDVRRSPPGPCRAPARAPRSRRASSSRRACAPRPRRSASRGRRLARVRLVGKPMIECRRHGDPWPTEARCTHRILQHVGTVSGVTDSMNSLLTITGVAKPHAPRHSTSMTV